MKFLLGKIEVVVGLILLLIFLIWTSSKCREAKVKTAAETTEAVADSLASIAKATTDSIAAKTALPDDLRKKIAARAAADSLTAATVKDTSAAKTASATGGAAAKTTPAEPTYSQLYVTIDKLKIRKGPGLKSEVLGELKLFDKVYFLEEVTDSTFQISLGKEVADEPYVKVKTKRGTVGWVYGAGVHYMKKKRPGVLE